MIDPSVDSILPRKELLLNRSVQRFRGGLVLKAHRLVYHSTLGLRVIQKKGKIRIYFVESERTW